MFFGAIALSIPLGKYIAGIYKDSPHKSDKFFAPTERLIYRISGIDPTAEMNWKEHLKTLLLINFIWFVAGIAILMNQGWLPLNPDGNPGMSADLAFNTSISFIVNCNLQHYSGESGLSYLSQLFLMFLQFVSAATGMVTVAVLYKALKLKQGTQLGNFYQLFVRSITRVLLPLSIITASLLLLNGMPMTFEGKETLTTLEGDTIQVSTGPVAAFVPIKHLGTNGGGYFGANSAHPFENPNYLTNIIEMIAQLLIPFAMVFGLGFYLNRKKLSYMIFSVMTIGFLLLAIPNILMETNGNPLLSQLGIDNSGGAMEGKEVRFGAAASGFWSIATTVISTGSVNSMHDSMMPLSGMNHLLAMMVNSFYGGSTFSSSSLCL
jgi:K+-transporting ATPase ATPase A chain